MSLEETVEAPPKASRSPEPSQSSKQEVSASNEIAASEVIDPAQIQKPSQIPPRFAQFAGSSTQGIVDVYCGILIGDVDAQPSARELLGLALDTGGLSNADYIYNQVSALYGKVQLPSFQSPSGNNVRCIVFVSGSLQGAYGAYHIPGTQEDFDRIVVDSLNASGSYSAGSGLAAAMAPLKLQTPRLLPIYKGAEELLGVLHNNDPRLIAAKPAAIHQALTIAVQSTLALKSAVEARNASSVANIPPSPLNHLSTKNDVPEQFRLVHANQEVLGLILAAARAGQGRQYLSTALFAAEIVESFQKLTGKADPGHTDGEAVSRVLSYKLAPEIPLVPGFNSTLTQEWWKHGHHDYASVNSEDDQSIDGNAAGVMFLEFLTDYLGVPMDQIIKYTPSTGGAPLGNTYASLLNAYPDIGQVAGADGASAFQKMVSLIAQNAQNPDGSLNLPANGNPFVGMPGSKQGGLFAGQTLDPGSLAQDAQAALGLETLLDQQIAGLRSVLQQIPADLSAPPAVAAPKSQPQQVAIVTDSESFGYGPGLVGSLVASLDQRVSPYRSPSYDQTLQQEFWKHVYNELPGTGKNTDRLQVITGTNQAPVAVQATGTVIQTKLEPDGDLHIRFQPDDPNFPTNQGAGESPLEIEVIYAGPVTQDDAKQAEQGYTNPFDTSQLTPGTRILAAGPLVFDRAHGKPTPDGNNVEKGLEIHPLAGMSVLTGGAASPPSPLPATPSVPSSQPAIPSPAAQLSADLDSAIGHLGTLNQTVGNLTALLQKMKGEAPPG